MQALAVRGEVARRRAQLAKVADTAAWDLSGVGQLDAVGAQILWHRWGQKLPEKATLSQGQKNLLSILAANPVAPEPPAPPRDWLGGFRAMGSGMFEAVEHGRDLLILLGEILFNFARLLVRPLMGPWREISAQVFRTGTQALGILALVGFLIGIVLSYL